jgi:hypothetical protein
MSDEHSQEIQINIKGLISPSAAEEVLRRIDSGVEIRTSDSYDFRKPLYSGPGEIVTFIALAVNSARLALSLYELLKTKTATPKAGVTPPPETEIFLVVQNRVIVISGGTPEEIEAILRKEISAGA